MFAEDFSLQSPRRRRAPPQNNLIELADPSLPRSTKLRSLTTTAGAERPSSGFGVPRRKPSTARADSEPRRLRPRVIQSLLPPSPLLRRGHFAPRRVDFHGSRHVFRRGASLDECRNERNGMIDE